MLLQPRRRASGLVQSSATSQMFRRWKCSSHSPHPSRPVEGHSSPRGCPAEHLNRSRASPPIAFSVPRFRRGRPGVWAPPPDLPAGPSQPNGVQSSYGFYGVRMRHIFHFNGTPHWWPSEFRASYPVGSALVLDNCGGASRRRLFALCTLHRKQRSIQTTSAWARCT